MAGQHVEAARIHVWNLSQVKDVCGRLLIAGTDSKMLRKASGDRELYISRAVNGPDNRKTVPCVSLLLPSIVSLEVFHI